MAINASHSNIGMNSVRLTGSGDVQYRNWAYRLDGGTWRSISAGPSTSASITVSGLSANRTYSYQIQAINVVTGLMEISSTGSFTTLNATAPTVTAGVSGIGITEFIITGSANYACRNWEYSLNGGAWQSLSTLSGVTSVSKKITGLSENTTYSVRVRATRTYNGVMGTSDAVSATTAKSQTAPVVTCSVTSITHNSFKITGSANYPCSIWQYSLDDGSTWTSLSAGTGSKTESKTITGLSVETSYKVKVRVTRDYNGVRGTSGTTTVTTLGASKLNSVGAVTADDSTVSFRFNITIAPGSGFGHRIGIYKGVGGPLITYITRAQLSEITTSGTHTINLTSDQRTAILNSMPNEKNFIGEFGMTTYDGETQVGGWSITTAIVRTLEANSAPILTGFAHSDENSKVTAVTSNYVQGLSDLKIVCDAATARNSASISKYGVTIGAKTVESASRTISFGTPTSCGINLSITAYVEDTRGYRTTLTDDKTISCYSKPAVLEWQARRKDSVGEQTALYVTGTILDMTGNSLKKAEYRTKPSDGSYGGWEELTGMANLGEISPGRRGYRYDETNWEMLDAKKTHTIQIRFQDLFEEYGDAITFIIARGIPLVSLRDGKVGINQYDPQGALDVVDEENEGIFINGNLIKDDIQTAVDDLKSLLNFVKTVSSSTGPTSIPLSSYTYGLLFISGASMEDNRYGVYLISFLNSSYNNITTLKSRSTTTVSISGSNLSISSSLAYYYAWIGLR